MKKAIITLLLAVLSAATAFAAEGTVVSVGNGAAVVDLGSAASFKVGAKVKLNGKAGKVTAAEDGKLTIEAPNAADLKAGDTVKVDKAAAALQGC